METLSDRKDSPVLEHELILSLTGVPVDIKVVNKDVVKSIHDKNWVKHRQDINMLIFVLEISFFFHK